MICIFPDYTYNSYLAQFVRQTKPHPPTILFIAASFLAMAGGFIRTWCYRELGRFFTFQMSLRKGHSLVTTGPYAYVRHPSYTGSLICATGVILMQSLPGSWVRESDALLVRILAGFWVVVVGVLAGVTVPSRVVDEDKMLHKEFGEEWERWSRRVRYRLIPGIY